MVYDYSSVPGTMAVSITLHLLHWPVCALLICTLVSSSFISEPNIPCLVAAPSGKAVDIICKVDNLHSCKNPKISWKKDGFKIKDSSIYGIWNAEWGVNSNEHVTLLRIRKFSGVDMGSYSCEMECGSSSKHERHAHACMLHPGTNLILCNQHKENDRCLTVFQNGVCNAECNHTSGLFDAFDCRPRMEACSPIYDNYCIIQHSNGNCDMGCNYGACGWDGGDCDDVGGAITPRESVLMIVADMPTTALINVSRNVSRMLTKSLRTVLHPLDEALNDRRSDLHQRVYTWSNSIQAIYYYVNPTRRSTVHKSLIYFKLGECSVRGTCFKDVSAAARFLQARLIKGWDLGIPLYAIGVLTSLKECSQQTTSILDKVPDTGSQNADTRPQENKQKGQMDYGVYIGASLGALAFIILVVGILCICKFNAKRSRDQLDAPEGREEPPIFDDPSLTTDSTDIRRSPSTQRTTLVEGNGSVSSARPIRDGNISSSVC